MEESVKSLVCKKISIETLKYCDILVHHTVSIFSISVLIFLITNYQSNIPGFDDLTDDTLTTVTLGGKKLYIHHRAYSIVIVAPVS